MLKLSPDQKSALDTLLDWHKSSDLDFITLGGYAGTGKTTLVSRLRKELHKKNKKLKVAFISYTGKSSRVLKSKLEEEKTMYDQDSVSTIHSLIYSPIENDKQEIVGWEKKGEIKADLIIIDEASMVNEPIWRDLLSYGIPIIAVGDHGQLPPIEGRFNLVENPMVRLEKIHRQAAKNPIIQLSTIARTDGVIPAKDFGKQVRKFSRDSMEDQEDIRELLEDYTKETLVLCGYNSTRVKLNQMIRSSLGFMLQEPETNDRVICLRNNRIENIYNGMLGTVQSIIKIDKDWYEAEIIFDYEDQAYDGSISAKQFNSQTPMNFTKNRAEIMQGDLFDFGYAITVHKAQGSQARRVILFEERFPKIDDENWRRWLYTAVTRAEEELYIVG